MKIIGLFDEANDGGGIVGLKLFYFDWFGHKNPVPWKIFEQVGESLDTEFGECFCASRAYTLYILDGHFGVEIIIIRSIHVCL